MMQSIAESWFPLFLNVCVQSSVLLVAGAVGIFMMRNSSAARRHPIAVIMLGAVLLLPILAWKLPLQWRFTPPLYRSADTSLQSADTNYTALVQPAIESQQQPASTVNMTSSMPSAADIRPGPQASSPNSTIIRQSGRFPVAILALWIVGCLGLLLRQTIMLLELGRVAQRHCGAAPDNVCRIIPGLAGAGKVTRRIKLVVDPGGQRVAPVTWGAARPVLLLPHDIVSWPESRVRPVLIHEIEHIRRGDWFVQSVAQAACAVYWFHPLAWYLYRKLRLDAEVACDDAVIVAGIPAPQYAEHLLAIVGAAKRRQQLPGAIGIFRCGQVSARVHAILAKGGSRKRATGRLLGTQAAATCGVLLFCVGIRLVEARQSGRSADLILSSYAGVPFNDSSSRFVTLNDGVRIELVAVGIERTAEGSNWWSPNGDARSPGPVVGEYLYHPFVDGPGEPYLSRSLLFRVHLGFDSSASTTGYIVEPAHHVDSHGLIYGRDIRVNGAALAANMPASGYVTLGLPPSEKQITYMFGIATSPWETVAVMKPVFNPAIGTKPFRSSGQGENAEIALGSDPEIRYADSRGTPHSLSVLGAHAPLGDVARRLLAYDREGHEVPLKETDSVWNAEPSIILPAESLARIAEVRLQTRPYQWAEFKHIALQPKSGLAAMRETPPTLPGYRHTFACGITVEMPGVMSHTGSCSWLRPDGSPAPGPWKEFAPDLLSPQWSPTAPILLYRTSSSCAANVTRTIRILPSENSTGSCIWHESSDYEMGPGGGGSGKLAINCTNGTKEVTLQYGIASGAWKTVAALQMPGDIRHHETGGTAEDISMRLSGHPEMRYQARSNQQLRIAFLPATGSTGDDAMRIVAVDRQGKSIVLHVTRREGPGDDVIGLSFHQSGSLYDFKRFDLSTIKEFCLQTRSYEWAEFKHIHLTPTL